MRQGLYDQSLTLLQPDLPPSLSSSDVAVWDEAIRGTDNAYLSRFSEAARHLKNAEKLVQTSQPQLMGEVTLRAGTLADMQWDLPAAQDAYRAALEFARREKDTFLEASALGSLGLVATQMERYDESVDWNRKALQLAQSLHAMSLLAKIEGNIAWSYYFLGDLENAVAENLAAEKDATTAGLHQTQVLSLTNAASAYFDLNELSTAEGTISKALTLSRNLNDISYVIECLQIQALVALGENRLDRAQQALDEALSLQHAAPDRPRDLYTRLLLGHLSAKLRDFSKAEEFYLSIVGELKAPTSLRWEAQAGLAEVHAAQGRDAQAINEFNASIKTITKARDALQHEEFRLSFLSSAIRFYDAYVNFLIERNRPLEALKIADLSRAQTLEQGLAGSAGGKKSSPPVSVNPQDIAGRLDATLLFYWLGQQHSYVWVITRARTSVFTLPGKGDIDAAVKNYRQSFLEPRDPLEAGNVAGEKLYSALLLPAEKLIAKNSRVIVLADGSLNSLNFETLIVSDSQGQTKPHYWIEDVTVATANSLALLSRSAAGAPPRSGRLLLVGNALAASPDFPPLPLAGKEIGLLENYFGPAQRTELTGTRATAAGFLASEPEKYSYLHFATHGTASRLRPLESAVVLSPEGDSYKLYARDVLKHPLNAYLVTISACNGAGMKAYAGEGLVGLSWAFLRAGAHNVIAGLWEVSNASTPQLMDELYKGIHAGEDPATALRKAKLTLVRSTGNYRKPFYWAPFQLYLGS